ncbi:hypothetical protein CNR37_00079 [Pseudomonas phage ventosus]|uniref:Uncharacterized protein n=1 Tax=Pseudomonas phage ventosus TaxID=2048980 RepID=A0A2H4P7Y0_9CAUD|nr:hypothetical protein CNR37_00079 [Pseudomonas phage ventosus]
MAFVKYLKYKSGFEMGSEVWLPAAKLIFCGVDEAPFQSVNSKISAAGHCIRTHCGV